MNIISTLALACLMVGLIIAAITNIQGGNVPNVFTFSILLIAGFCYFEEPRFGGLAFSLKGLGLGGSHTVTGWPGTGILFFLEGG